MSDQSEIDAYITVIAQQLKDHEWESACIWMDTCEKYNPNWFPHFGSWNWKQAKLVTGRWRDFVEAHGANGGTVADSAADMIIRYLHRWSDEAMEREPAEDCNNE